MVINLNGGLIKGDIHSFVSDFFNILDLFFFPELVWGEDK